MTSNNQNHAFDVVIIGAGVIGCACAYELSQLKLKIAVIEKHSDVSEGASKANSGLVHAGFDAKPGSLKAKYNVRGNKMFPALCERLGVHYLHAGALVVAFSQEERGALDELLERGRANGVPALRIIEQTQLRQMEPNISEKAVAALYAPTAGIVCPYGLTCALADFACVNGTGFIFDTEILGIEKSTEGYILRTNNGEYTARAVINTAGTASAKIAAMVGQFDVHITPRRGEYWMVDRALEGFVTRTIFQLPSEKGKGILISPTADGTLLIGPTSYPVEDGEDTATTAQGLEQVYEEARRICPSLSKSSLFTTFAGNRATPSNGDFIVGEAQDAPLFWNCAGMESPGLSSAPAIAQDIAAQVAVRLGAQKKSEGELGKYEKVRKRFFDMTNEERKAAIAQDGEYGQIVCRCELVTEAEVRAACRRPVGARSLDGVKKRTRAGMGRCQAGFCSPRVAQIISEETGVDICSVTKFGGDSRIVSGTLGEAGEENE